MCKHQDSVPKQIIYYYHYRFSMTTEKLSMAAEEECID